MRDEDGESLLRAAINSDEVRFGGNSRVSKVSHFGINYAVKDYSHREDGDRRLSREWWAVSFLSERLPKRVASAIWRSPVKRVGIYSWVPGIRPSLDENSVAGMLEILCEMETLSSDNLRVQLPKAVDAIRGPNDLVEQVLSRQSFLSKTGDEMIEGYSAQIYLILNQLSTNFAGRDSLENNSPILSFSDFGPHNLVWEPLENQFFAVDLEFFGTDDRHKLIGDTILHPQTSWTPHLLEKFLTGAQDAIGTSGSQLDDLLPLLSLKWATIVLAKLVRDGSKDLQNYDHEQSSVETLIEHYIRMAGMKSAEDILDSVCSRDGVVQDRSQP